MPTILQDFIATVGVHSDHRRTIEDVAFPDGFIVPFEVRQVKLVKMAEVAVAQRLIVGNHYHTEESGRQELFVAVGPADLDLFECATLVEGAVCKFNMKQGHTWHILPPIPHAFIPLVAGAQLWGFSNVGYNASHDVPYKLL